MDPPTARKAGKTKEKEAQQSSTTRSILKMKKAIFSEIAFFIALQQSLWREFGLDSRNIVGDVDTRSGSFARDSYRDRHAQG